MSSCAVVLGDYVNGYAIVRELYEEGIREIVVITYNKKLAFYSNKVFDAIEIDQCREDLLRALNGLNKRFDKLILFPTDDWFVEQLVIIENEIINFAFIPFNTSNAIESSNKVYQYQCCEKADIPYPKTISIRQIEDLLRVNDLTYPVIMKPVVRNDLSDNVFRSMVFKSEKDIDGFRQELSKLLSLGLSFLVSEIVPGSSHGSIYAYSAYVDKNGSILNEWVGRKLSQYPDDYGVFSSASNEAPEEIWEQGRKLVKELNIYGFCEPEFKFDFRDGKYKLMEVNLRSMMWNEVGARSGVKLHYTQWCYANNMTIPSYTQNQSDKIVLMYYKHELLNLMFLKGYFPIFKSIWKNKTIYWAGCYKNDFSPIWNNIKLTARTIIKRLIRR